MKIIKSGVLAILCLCFGAMGSLEQANAQVGGSEHDELAAWILSSKDDHPIVFYPRYTVFWDFNEVGNPQNIVKVTQESLFYPGNFPLIPDPPHPSYAEDAAIWLSVSYTSDTMGFNTFDIKDPVYVVDPYPMWMVMSGQDDYTSTNQDTIWFKSQVMAFDSGTTWTYIASTLTHEVDKPTELLASIKQSKCDHTTDTAYFSIHLQNNSSNNHEVYFVDIERKEPGGGDTWTVCGRARFIDFPPFEQEYVYAAGTGECSATPFTNSVDEESTFRLTLLDLQENVEKVFTATTDVLCNDPNSM